MEDFRRLGFCTLPSALGLGNEACAALRHDLDPWFADELAADPDGAFGSWWHKGPESHGTGRVAVSDALVELAELGCVAERSVEFMLQPGLLDFARAALGSTPQLDDVMIAAYPHVGEGGHDSPLAVSDADGHSSDIHVWHRDSHNHHGHLAQFHRTWDDTTAEPPPPRPYTPPSAVNYLCYLQDAVLRLVPRSHLDFTEIPFDGAHRRSHPNEVALELRAGEVVAVHNDMIHSGMLCTSPDERRYFLSVYFTAAGLPSRDLPSCVRDTPPDHPLQRALAGAAEPTLQCLGLAPPSGSAYDFLLNLSEDQKSPDSETQQFADGVLLADVTARHAVLSQLRSVSKLLASWGCDDATVNAGLFHAVYRPSRAAAPQHNDDDDDEDHDDDPGSSYQPFTLQQGDQLGRRMVAEQIGVEVERVVHLHCGGGAESESSVADSRREQCMLAALRLAVCMCRLDEPTEPIGAYIH